MAKSNLLAELRRRHVWRVAAAYAVASWLLIQVATQVFPFFDIPNWTVRLVVVLLALGFPVAIVLAWVYELTPAGIRRTEPADSPEAREPLAARAVGRKLDAVIIAILGLAVLLLLGNQFLWRAGMQADSNANPAASATPSVKPAAASAVPAKSIAVLPFANEGPDQEQRLFADGLTEDLTTALSQFEGLKVISRHSAFQFRDSTDNAKTIGGKLGVARLLEGTVRHAGDVVRITASLVNAADGSTLWAQRYDRPFEDLFALQDEITKAVATAMQTELLTVPGAVVQSDRPPSGNLAAYTAIQHGNAYYALGTEAGYRRAIDAASEAIALDPRYATAFASLAYAWTALAAEFLNGQEATRAYATARTAIDTALDLDPNSSRAHWVHAYLLATADMNWSGAEDEYRAALRLAPNDASMKFRLAGMSATTGHVHEAIDLTREALVANPRAASWYYWLATYLSAAGRLDEAREAIDTAIELQPGANGYRQQLAIIEILYGNADAALKAARQEPPGGWHDAAVTLALQIGPDRTVADDALKDFTASYARNGAWQIAEVHALRGDADATFEWLDRAWKNRDSGIQYLLYDPFVLRHRSDPRFAAFCAKVGLTATTDAVAMR